MEKLSLNGNWQLQGQPHSAPLPAVVPGCVHLDLLRAGRIEDPFYRDNEDQLYWIGETDWTYERRFTATPEFLNQPHVVLVCHGLDTLATINVNGTVVGKADNMFRTWVFDVKSLLIAGENSIQIRFDAPVPFLRARDNERGQLPAWVGAYRVHDGGWLRKEPCNFGWDWGPRVVTSGIWRDIELIAFEGRLNDVHIRQEHAEDGRVILHIQVTAEYPAVVQAEVQVQVSLNRQQVAISLNGQMMATARQQLENGRATLDIAIESPELWWIAGMGGQPLYDIDVQLTGTGGAELDKKICRIGLRRLTLERHADQWGESFYFAINGVPFFAKGANWIPADTFAPRVSRADYERLLQDAVAANMNMLRVWGGGIYEQDEFYDLCDRYGIAIWQDFMFACGTYPANDVEFMDNVRAEAEDNVRRLRHHACMALWCGNNELEQGLVGDAWTVSTMSWEDYGKLFDTLLPDVVNKLDPDRAYWPCSPHSPIGDRSYWMNPACGDTHLWAVWHGREPFEWYRTCLHRFCSEFGFQSFPEPATIETFTEPEDRNLTSYIMEYHQRSGIGNSTIIHYMLDWFRLPTSFESGVWLSQIQQGMAMKYAVEHWRRNMPRTMGTLYWQLNDCWPAPSWSSIDSLGRWKALHYMAKKFYAPLLISGLEDADAGTVEIHVTSDLLDSREAMVYWQAIAVDGEHIEYGQRKINTPRNGNLLVETLKLKDTLQTVGARNILILLRLEVGGTTVSDNLVLFARPKHLSLRIPEIQVQVEPSGSGYDITLKAAYPALWCWLSLPQGNGRFSDNFVHLINKAAVIHLDVPAEMTLEDVRQQLKVQSLIDTSR